MSLKNAALLALCGSVMVATILIADLILNTIAVVRGLLPPVSMFSSTVYAFAALTVSLFFHAFHRKQP